MRLTPCRLALHMGETEAHRDSALSWALLLFPFLFQGEDRVAQSFRKVLAGGWPLTQVHASWDGDLQVLPRSRRGPGKGDQDPGSAMERWRRVVCCPSVVALCLSFMGHVVFAET